MVENAVTTGEIAGDAYFQWYSEGVPPWTVDSIFSSQGGGAFEGNCIDLRGGGRPANRMRLGGCGVDRDEPRSRLSQIHRSWQVV